MRQTRSNNARASTVWPTTCSHRVVTQIPPKARPGRSYTQCARPWWQTRRDGCESSASLECADQ
jgi:hypothetical protein